PRGRGPTGVTVSGRGFPGGCARHRSETPPQPSGRTRAASAPCQPSPGPIAPDAAKTPRHIALDDLLELAGDVRPAQCHGFLAVDEHRRRRGLARAGQRNADVGVLGLARTVDDAAHDGKVERLYPGVLPAPAGHALPPEPLA